MGKKGPLWWRESDWLLRGSSAANQILLRHSGPILSSVQNAIKLHFHLRNDYHAKDHFNNSFCFVGCVATVHSYETTEYYDHQP